MKRISFLLLGLVILVAATLRGQDAAVEERLNKLNGLVQDLLEDKATQKKQIEGLAKEIESLRESQNHSSAACATQEELKRKGRKRETILFARFARPDLMAYPCA